MFSIVYRFTTKEGKQEVFIQAWEALTKLIRKYENSGGSRLHRLDDKSFIAYAVWDSKEHWESAGEALPLEADKWRKQMRESCISIDTEMELEVISDLLL